MPNYPRVIAGAIFDIDDTLLDNHPAASTLSLHERSRLAAAQKIAQRRGLVQLQQLTAEQHREAFLTAKAHALDATLWNTLFIAGLVATDEIDPNHELLLELMELKIQLHEAILRTEGKAVPGATRFVKTLAANVPSGCIAIASTAIRREIMIFLEMTYLTHFFPDDHIISRELVTRPKPHPQAYNLAFERLGLPSDARPNVLAFEDDPRGIMSANAAGLFTCAITTRFSKAQLTSLETPPDLIADSFAEFETILGLQ